MASRDFKVGDLIFNDKYAVSIKLTKDQEDIYAQVLRLPKQDQDAFFELTESKKIMQNLSHPLLRSLSTEQLKSHAIFYNNSFTSSHVNNVLSNPNSFTDDRSMHLYLSLSLVNHCCDPNSFKEPTDYSGKIMELRAIKEIKKGEEITISYVDFSVGFLEEKELRQINLDHWNFECNCPHCLQPEDDQFKELRKEFKKLERMKDKIVEEMNLQEVPAFLLDPEKLKENVGHLEKYVDFIIKLNNPDAFFSSWKILEGLVTMSQLAGRFDLAKKGLDLLKEWSEKGKFTRMLNINMQSKELSPALINTATTMMSDPNMQQM